MERENIFKSFLGISFFYILFFFGMFFLTFIGFILKVPLQFWYLPLSFFTGLIFLGYYNKKQNLSGKEIFLQLLIILLSFIIFGFISLYFFDRSWDGKNYHQFAVILLERGWNPIYEYFDSFLMRVVWVECYPKLSWILQANFFKNFNLIEFGKISNYLLGFTVFLLSLAAFNKIENIKPYQNFCLSLLVVANPVTICQISTFLNDIYMYYFILIPILLVILNSKNEISDKTFIVFSVMSITMSSNVKFGGLFYSALFLLLYAIYGICIKSKCAVKKSVAITICSIVLILLSGINPYFTNIERGRHPLHPLMGSGKMDLMTYSFPPEFKKHSRFYKLFYSTFGKAQNIFNKSVDTEINLKLPFTISDDEDSFSGSGYDMRIAGLGYFWSGIILLTILLVLLSKKENKQNRALYYFIMSFLILSVVLNPESWLARYTAQFWVVPVFIVAFSLNNINQKKINVILIVCIIFLMMINDAVIFQQNLESMFHYKQDVILEMKTLKESKKQPILLYSYIQKCLEIPYQQKLMENNIKFKVVDKEYYEQHKEDFYIFEVKRPAIAY